MSSYVALKAPSNANYIYNTDDYSKWHGNNCLSDPPGPS